MVQRVLTYINRYKYQISAGKLNKVITQKKEQTVTISDVHQALYIILEHSEALLPQRQQISIYITALPRKLSLSCRSNSFSMNFQLIYEKQRYEVIDKINICSASYLKIFDDCTV
ncbi:Hypothetical_protein [Hexamita inflata]|uniref:Hypothetical_protein n=1 Tax=Hexamita inflata TaxID=28002 RepID=A0AA86QUS9_9EUKA|nr:Hypothetical protein HINF_LOCUS45640 [Hexamita inflata]